MKPHTETINGLLSMKPDSRPPVAGEERWLTWEQRTSKNNKPWIKVKNNTQEYGGKLCQIISAEKTDFQDPHGNLSYSIEFTPIGDNDQIPMTHDNKGVALPGVDEARAHIMQAVNLYNICVDAVDTSIKPHIENCSAELYQAAIASLFIESSRAGLVSKMPTTVLKK